MTVLYTLKKIKHPICKIRYLPVGYAEKQENIDIEERGQSRTHAFKECSSSWNVHIELQFVEDRGQSGIEEIKPEL